MKLAVALVVALPGAAAAGTWADVPALVTEAMKPVEPALAACTKGKARTIPIVVSRAKDGTAIGRMPLPGYVGVLGLTAEDDCLMKAAAAIPMPALPAIVERVSLVHAIGSAAGAFGDWADLEARLAALVDAPARTALAACDRKARTVRVTIDRGTRVWLPAWQFHSPSGDGSTPPAQAKAKACLGKPLRAWKPPALPPAMPELQLAIPVSP